MELLEQVWSKGTKVTGELEHLSGEEMLRDMGMFSLKKRQMRGDFIVIVTVSREGSEHGAGSDLVLRNGTRAMGRN